MEYKIVPHLWFDKEAKQAAAFYAGLFPNSRLTGSILLEDTPGGDAESITFELMGQPFAAISAGPHFKLNSSISIMVVCETADEVDRLYDALRAGGSDLMEIGEYPFSPRYAWVQDQFGVNWQLIQLAAEEAQRKIRPALLFANAVCGKAEEAARFYTSLLPNSSMGYVSHYAPGQLESDTPKVAYMDFVLAGQTFVAMDHGMTEGDDFNEAFSFMIRCDSQQEIDFYWDKLSAVPEAEACGWVKDQFGVSWQILYAKMEDLLFQSNKEQVARVVQAMLPMTKLDVAALEKAYMGEEHVDGRPE